MFHLPEVSMSIPGKRILPIRLICKAIFLQLVLFSLIHICQNRFILLIEVVIIPVQKQDYEAYSTKSGNNADLGINMACRLCRLKGLGSKDIPIAKATRVEASAVTFLDYPAMFLKTKYLFGSGYV
jgi:hypothetical protein